MRDSRRAVAMAAEAGADDVRMHALGCLGHALALRGEFGEAVATLDESLRLARASGEAGQVGWHAGSMATALLLAGRGPEASRLLDGVLDRHASRVLALLRARGPAGRRAARRSGSLIERERTIAELAARGFTDRQIADHLHLGDRTVETHLAHVYAKLQVAGRAELRARLRGIVPERLAAPLSRGSGAAGNFALTGCGAGSNMGHLPSMARVSEQGREDRSGEVSVRVW